ncbi:CPBP family intramembrane glutamic endopeptidase [Deinococcus peraridilitoris]|uniref:CAAX amino terminal protease family n=1 Tax=Deinococcus peraridilitoris (strain DSM 19664 / LMG 22246 / CIP 109416 / KR-200) TaxID=937777 RepID=L0A592_DEIPD|nr:type II CAAX endopeptidase family protein [Deinococcus peraridilitoris]AFZ68170.1 CAAX amino terminal protease family [Deinococcus peraridilitoris DSM 19664]
MTSESGASLPSAAPELSHLNPVTANRAMLLYLLFSAGLQLLLGLVFRLSIGAILVIEGLLLIILLPLMFPGAWRELRQHHRWRTPPDLLTMLGAFGLGFVASRAFTVFLQAVWPGSSQALQEYNLQFLQGGGVLLVLIGGGLLIPFVEEWVFRGFGLTGYERRRSPLMAALWTSLLFALIHGVPAQVLAVLPLGWVIARAVQFSGSFWTGVGMHVLNNSLSLGLAALLLSSPVFEQLLQESASSARVSLAAGLAALVVALAALWGAAAWLRVRETRPIERGPLWSASLLVPLAFFVLSAAVSLSGQRLSQLIGLLRPQ